jgi:hypothetical protein
MPFLCIVRAPGCIEWRRRRRRSLPIYIDVLSVRGIMYILMLGSFWNSTLTVLEHSPSFRVRIRRKLLKRHFFTSYFQIFESAEKWPFSCVVFYAYTRAVWHSVLC